MKNRQKGKFTIVSNDVIMDKRLSAKAKGVYVYLHSRREDWQFYEAEMVRHFNDGKHSISSAIKELIECKYLLRIQKRIDGRFSHYEWILNPTESDFTENGKTETRKSDFGKSDFGKSDTNNTNSNNTDSTNTDYILKEKNIKKRNVFQKPSVKEIRDYCLERKNNVDAENFFDFYESKDWMIGKNKMKNWKASVRTWERKSNNQVNQPQQEKPTRSAEELAKMKAEHEARMEEKMRKIREESFKKMKNEQVGN
jgi:hypothetical protein